MSNERRAQANRLNAKASTGPRTSSGKARAARNARRHGLSLPALVDPAWSAEIQALAREIAGHGASAELLELAARIAAAHIDVMRVRQARHQIIDGYSRNPNDNRLTNAELRKQWLQRNGGLPAEKATPSVVKAESVDTPAELARALTDLSASLTLLDRYERRARSRRKFATRAFDSARIRANFKDTG